jgi:hypothetical protein
LNWLLVVAAAAPESGSWGGLVGFFGGVHVIVWTFVGVLTLAVMGYGGWCWWGKRQGKMVARSLSKLDFEILRKAAANKGKITIDRPDDSHRAGLLIGGSFYSGEKEQGNHLKAFIAFEEMRKMGLFKSGKITTTYDGSMQVYSLKEMAYQILKETPEPKQVLKETPEPKQELSDEARQLLLEACKGNGMLMKVADSAGLHIQASERNFTELGNRRSEALWQAALEELCDLGLAEDLGAGSVFKITHEGYRVEDLLVR